MKSIHRLMVNICSEKLEESKTFYTRLFDFTVEYDSNWFVHLVSEKNNLELGIIDASSEVVPDSLNAVASGFYITFVVESAEHIFEIAQKEKFEILEAPVDTAYGQRRVLLKDPNGVVVDVSSPIPNFF